MNIKKFKEDAQYRVAFKVRAEYQGQTFYPGEGHEVTLRGDVAKSLAESIEDATEI